jgi:hypothetical protein
MKLLLLILPVAAFMAVTGCRSVPDPDAQWLENPTNEQMQESADTVMRLRHQLGKE